jgi:hypothetical protein
MEGKQRLGPQVLMADSSKLCTAIYGFSGKEAYDRFSGSIETELQPYPLVRVFVQDQAGATDDGLKLLVLDAAGPEQAGVEAATMQAVLEAFEKKTDHVAATHHLTFDAATKSYRVEETSK